MTGTDRSSGPKLRNPGGLLRILDASGNRLSEGLRVLEDQCRFALSLSREASALKSLRHRSRNSLLPLTALLLQARDTASDGGWRESAEAGREVRKSPLHLMLANFRRSEEACRSLFEAGKTLQQICENTDHPAALTDFRIFETIRKEIYTLEKVLVPALQSTPRSNPLPDGLYCLTHREGSRGRGNIATARKMLEGGARILQYREKDLPGRQLYREALEIRKMTRDFGCLFYINDYPGLALMVEADGVHAGQDDYNPVQLRKILGESLVIGLSTHSPEQLNQAHEWPVDYLGTGPVFATKTKKNVCSPVGLEYLDYAAAHSRLPCVAIGGIKKHNLPQVLERGAGCTALVTEITGAEDPAREVRQIREMITRGENNDSDRR